jgi:uncharacterized protein YndB with AHSA1/START domain
MTEKTPRTFDRRTIIERSYVAALDEVWELWITAEGIESWWGPGGFSVKVLELDLRPGGRLCYAMTAIDPPQIQFMESAGMPLTTETSLTYLEIVPGKSIAYSHRADFIPGVAPYDFGTRVEFFVEGARVRMVISLDPMHSDEWSQRAAMGMESQLQKLDRREAQGESLLARA